MYSVNNLPFRDRFLCINITPMKRAIPKARLTGKTQLERGCLKSNETTDPIATKSREMATNVRHRFSQDLILLFKGLSLHRAGCHYRLMISSEISILHHENHINSQLLSECIFEAWSKGGIPSLFWNYPCS
jgi:hypothetical protein